MAMRAGAPVSIIVTRRGTPASVRVRDAGGGVVDSPATEEHTYVAEEIIPRRGSFLRLETEIGIRTMRRRCFRFANVDNPGVTFDVRLEDVLEKPDGSLWVVEDVKAFPPNSSRQTCIQVDCYGKA